VDCVYLFTYLLLGMNHVGIQMLLNEYILSGRRNIARTGKDGSETDSHEDRRNLYLLRSLDDYYYYYYYESEVILTFDKSILHVESPCVTACVCMCFCKAVTAEPPSYKTSK
jgi:hypothetical protein